MDYIERFYVDLYTDYMYIYCVCACVCLYTYIESFLIFHENLFQDFSGIQKFTDAPVPDIKWYTICR